MSSATQLVFGARIENQSKNANTGYPNIDSLANILEGTGLQTSAETIIILSRLYGFTEKNGAVIRHIEVKRPSMEDIFFKYAGESLEDSAAEEAAKKNGGKKVKKG